MASPMRGFRPLEHTADAGIVAYGADMRALFANAAQGLFHIITDLRRVQERESVEVAVQAPDRDSLLVEWLNELIFLFDTRYLLLKRFDITDISDSAVRAVCHGEPVDLSRHEIKTGVKSTTYHQLRIEQGPQGYSSRIIFDL